MSAKDGTASPSPNERHHTLLLASPYLPLILTLGTAPLVARVLGVGGRGAVALALLINEASTALFRFGLPEATSFFYKERGATPGQLLRAVVHWGVIVTPLSVVTGGVLVFTLSDTLDGSTRAILFVLVAWSPLMDTAGLAFRNILVGRGDLEGLARFTPIASATTAAWVLVGSALDLLTPATFLVATCGGSLASYAYARSRVGVLDRAEPYALRPLLRYGSRAMPASFADFIGGRFDQLLVAPLLGIQSLGLYAVAISINSVVSRIGSGLALGAFSRVRLSDPKGRDAPASRAIRDSLMLSSLLGLAIASATPIVVPVAFGAEFEDAVAITLILVPGSIALAASYVTWQCANALGQPHAAALSQGAGLLWVAALSLPAVQVGGLAGAAAVASAAGIVRLWAALRVIHRAGVSGVLPGPADFADLYRRLRKRLG